MSGSTAGSHAAVPTAARATRGLVDVMMLTSVAMFFLLSGYALEAIGIPYLSPTGGIVTKIHPGTYLLVLTLILVVLGAQNPFAYAASLMLRRLGSTFLLVVCCLIVVFIQRFKPNDSAAFVFDTLMFAAIVSLLLADAPERTKLRLATLLHTLMISNAVLAVIEMVTGWRLFPFGVADYLQTWDYRSTAFLGHPLIGALVTGVYAVILLLRSDLPGITPFFRTVGILACLAAMPALGARTSFIIVYAVAGLSMSIAAMRFLVGGKARLDVVALVALAVPASAAVVVGLVASGFFDGLIGRFLEDHGSAQTRLRLFELFNQFRLEEMLIGYSFTQLGTHVRMEGLSEGIENSWAGHLLRFGIPMSVVLWGAIAGFIAEVLWLTSRFALLPIVFTLLVLTTSVGISGKTGMLTMTSILMFVLLAPRPRPLVAEASADTAPRPNPVPVPVPVRAAAPSGLRLLASTTAPLARPS